MAAPLDEGKPQVCSGLWDGMGAAWGQRWDKKGLSGPARRVRVGRERERGEREGDSEGGQRGRETEGLGLWVAGGRQEAEALFRTFSSCCPSSMAGLRV